MTLMTAATVDADGDGDDDEAASFLAIQEKCSFIRFSCFCCLLLMSLNCFSGSQSPSSDSES